MADAHFTNSYSAHGRMGNQAWAMPSLVSKSTEVVREDHGNTIQANEFLDSPEVLEEKIKLIASLLQKSKRTSMYCGAGLSKESGLKDAASRGTSLVFQNTLVNGLFAAPNFSQICLARLHKINLIQKFFTQNHDGLLQKAGIPQEHVIEIHGGWYDPSNPPVKYTETLKSDLLDQLLHEAQESDLLLVLGTSLSGMTADKIAEKVSGRSISQKSLGIVIINLQQTRLDHVSSIRVWSKISDAFKLLEKIFKLDEVENPVWMPSNNHNNNNNNNNNSNNNNNNNNNNSNTNNIGDNDIFQIPYDNKGQKSETLHPLDLSIGTTLIIADPHASNFGCFLTVTEKDQAGDWVLMEQKQVDDENGSGIKKRRRLHRWWIDVARRGQISQFPIVNKKMWEFTFWNSLGLWTG